MSTILPFKSGASYTISSDGGGPEDPMLDKRVAMLEGDMKEVKTSLSRLEVSMAEIKGALGQMPKATDLVNLRSDISEVKGRIANLPTTWTLIAFAIGSCLASAGLAFTIARLIKP